jgi:replicative DNA helicase
MTDTALRSRNASGPSALDALDALVLPGRVVTAPRAVATGFRALDEVLGGGLRPGELLVLGGKPGRGKTIAALQWARHVARSGKPAVYACYEHDRDTLLTRLLALELREAAARQGCADQLRLELLRERLAAAVAGDLDAPAVLASDPLLADAADAIRDYGSRLALVGASTVRTDLAVLEDLVARGAGDSGASSAALFVDYLQKVPAGPPGDESERVATVTSGLKELALRQQAVVVAVTAADQAGLESRRLHLHHSRGSTALAYDCDVAVVLNDKVDIVSRLHLAYDSTRLYDFQARVVFSVEKNRRGVTDVDLEFVRDFGSYRFDPEGRWVAERLWVEGSVEA